MRKVIVTGGTGRLGSAVVGQLLRLAPQSLLAVSVRYPKSARSWSDEGVEVRHGDFDIPETLPKAFAGADRLLVVSTSADNETRIRQHRRAFEAAERAGVRHIFYTSIMQREGSPFLAAEGHLQSEADLVATSVPGTIFRNGQYMENLPLFLRLGLEEDAISLPADGPTSWVALRDLAEGIARTLIGNVDDRQGRSRVLTLTGPKALDFADITRLASKALNRPLVRKVITAEEFVLRVASRGLGAGFGKVLESGFRSRASGELAQVDPLLTQILGRPLRTVEEELPALLEKVTEGHDRWADRFVETKQVAS